jgi:ABC-type sugar transport system ATPase subunit
MRAEISRLRHHFGITTIYVTHDRVEAMTMGYRILVMRGRDGRRDGGTAGGTLRLDRIHCFDLETGAAIR